MKYVMFTNSKTGIRCPVFFPDIVTHASVSLGPDWIPTSAGHFLVRDLQAYGDSSSLGLNSKPDDREICIDSISELFAATCHVMQCPEINLAELKLVLEAKAKASAASVKLPWCVWWWKAEERRTCEFATFQEAERAVDDMKVCGVQAYLANVKDLKWHPSYRPPEPPPGAGLEAH